MCASIAVLMWVLSVQVSVFSNEVRFSSNYKQSYCTLGEVNTSGLSVPHASPIQHIYRETNRNDKPSAYYSKHTKLKLNQLVWGNIIFLSDSHPSKITCLNGESNCLTHLCTNTVMQRFPPEFVCTHTTVATHKHMQTQQLSIKKQLWTWQECWQTARCKNAAPSIHPFTHPLIQPSISSSIHLPASLFIGLSICLFIHSSKVIFSSGLKQQL